MVSVGREAVLAEVVLSGEFKEFLHTLARPGRDLGVHKSGVILQPDLDRMDCDLAGQVRLIAAHHHPYLFPLDPPLQLPHPVLQLHERLKVSEVESEDDDVGVAIIAA